MKEFIIITAMNLTFYFLGLYRGYKLGKDEK